MQHQGLGDFQSNPWPRLRRSSLCPLFWCLIMQMGQQEKSAGLEGSRDKLFLISACNGAIGVSTLKITDYAAAG